MKNQLNETKRMQELAGVITEDKTVKKEEIRTFPSNLSYETIERIDGLINQRDLELFKNALENITNDLEMEGFELNDIKAYLQMELNEYLGN
jgi:hypothetical protein